MSLSKKSGLDTLLDTPVERAANFALGASVVRAALKSSASDFVILPERGCLPIYWASQGLGGLEEPIPIDELRLPIGTNVSEDGRSMGGLNKPEKLELIGNALESTGLKEKGEATILDEVQNGGTISFAARGIAQLMNDSHERLSVIAAQDTLFMHRTSTLAGAYRSIALNQAHYIKTATVVPMPLIATDKDPLLNTLVRKNGTDLKVDIKSNLFSELICRTLGSVARRADIAKPVETLTTLLYAEGGKIITRSDKEIEEWAANVVNEINRRQKRS